MIRLKILFQFVLACLASLPIGAASTSSPAPPPPPALPAGINGEHPKQYLTIRDCVRLALQQNLDISIQRLNPAIADADVLAAEGIFDITWKTSLFDYERNQPQGLRQAGDTFVRTPTPLESRTYDFDTGFSGLTPLGTTYDIGLSISRLAVNTFADTASPQWSTFAGLQIVQPLARGFGWEVNTSQIRINRKSKDISYQQFVQMVMETIAVVEQTYYDLIYDLENVRVNEQSLQLAQRFLDESRKRLEVGTLARLDIIKAEAEVADREGQLIDAKRGFEQRQNTFKQLINRDVSTLRDALVVPVDRPSIAARPIDAIEHIREGLSNRPEYLQRKLELERSHIFVKYYKNSLLPRVDLTGSYGWAGLSQDLLRKDRDFRVLDSSLGQISRGDAPSWTAGLTVTVPLGNQTSRGNYRHWKLAAEQALLSLKKIEQDIIVSVDAAAIEAQAKAKLITARKAATRLQEESLRAEEEKLKAGTSTTYNVLQFQRDLTNARVEELRAIADFNKALVDLNLKDGTILKRHNVAVEPDPMP
jgi:outer membrane protein TolC